MEQTKKVAVVLSEFEARTYSILRGVARFARPHTRWRMERIHMLEFDGFLAANPRRWDGVIGSISPKAVATMDRHRVPFVSVSRPYACRVRHEVVNDDVAIGRMGAEHLMSLGLRQFVFLGMEDRLFSADRAAGFRAAIEASDGKYVILPDSQTPAGAMLNSDWVASLPRPIGAMCCNDVKARHLIQAVYTLGIQIPDELAVLGVDNDEGECEVAPVPVSSIVLPSERVGYEAASLLHRLLQGERVPPTSVRFPPLRVEVRQSTDGRVVSDPVVRHALRLIRDNSGRALKVPELTAALHVSRRRLEVRFREALGRTIHDEVLRARFERARRLLADGSMTVTEVLSAAGFSDHSRFSAQFHARFGVQPSAYRRRAVQGTTSDGMPSRRTTGGHEDV